MYRYIKVLDCSWYLPAMARDPIAEHAARRVPGARYFDVDCISDAASPLPHMLPAAAQFAAACDALVVGLYNFANPVDPQRLKGACFQPLSF